MRRISIFLILSLSSILASGAQPKASELPVEIFANLAEPITLMVLSSPNDSSGVNSISIPSSKEDIRKKYVKRIGRTSIFNDLQREITAELSAESSMISVEVVGPEDSSFSSDYRNFRVIPSYSGNISPEKNLHLLLKVH